jgi:hypothetical protein
MMMQTLLAFSKCQHTGDLKRRGFLRCGELHLLGLRL